MLSQVVLNDKQLEAVGCLALESANLEFLIDTLIEEHCGETVVKLLLANRMLTYSSTYGSPAVEKYPKKPGQLTS